jgi:uncharacterized protein (TIGR02271 family)
MTTRTITAIYDSESEAQEARAQLLNHGLEDADVRIVSHQLTASRVGTNAVDLDQRTEQWRAEGWSGPSEEFRNDDASLSPGAMATDARMSDTSRDQQSIPVVEERLRVGKREVDRGGVRVRSYIVEEPVRENVSLREEHVEIERRPGRAAASPEMFRERTIEVSERGEEAVVAKDAVVTEEVVVRKTADECTEAVEDTVRRTEVDVQDTRGTRDPATTTGSKSRPRRPS